MIRLRRLPVGQVNPFEAWLLLAAELVGWFVLSGVAQPTSVRDALPGPLLKVWALTMALGGVASLTGLFWWGAVHDGVVLKRTGLIALGTGALVYGIAAALLGRKGIAICVYNVSFAIACLAEIRQMGRRLREWQSVARGKTGV